MCSIMLPIKPKYSQAILSGEKTFELRRKIPKRKLDYIYIYETSPTMKVVGKIIVKQVHKNTKQEIWNLTRGENSVSKKEFNTYFSGLLEANAIEIDKVEKYDKYRSLKDFKVNHPPQGFIYIKD